MIEGPEEKTTSLLQRHGFRFKKKWGQNFILDKNLLKRITAGAGIQPGDPVVEIGPGAGTLTGALVEAGARVLAIEIDPSLQPILAERLQGTGTVIVQGDVMKLNLDELAREHLSLPYKIVANLPYYLTTPLLMNILENRYQIDLMVVMVQWEVAQRLTAQPAGKDYGAITLAVRYYTEPRILFKVPRHLFTPAPEVDSAVIMLKRLAEPRVDVEDEKLLFKLIKAAFGQRRKTLLNALGSVDHRVTKEKLQEMLQAAGINGGRRGETLSLEEFAGLTNVWNRLGIG